MTVSLSPELQQFLEEQVRAGKFDSPDAAVAEAVRQMKEREEKLAWLRAEIQKGIDNIEHGRVSEWNVEELKAELRQKYVGTPKV
jgi:antitoxin ParD1/3/4